MPIAPLQQTISTNEVVSVDADTDDESTSDVESTDVEYSAEEDEDDEEDDEEDDDDEEELAFRVEDDDEDDDIPQTALPLSPSDDESMPSETCRGCRDNLECQDAHMDYGGCLYIDYDVEFNV